MAGAKPGRFRRYFNRAARITILSAVFATAAIELSIWHDDRNREGGEPLTSGEVELLHSIFGDDIDTDVMRKHMEPDHPSMAGSVTGGSRRHMEFWGWLYHSNDYSQNRGRKLDVFVHEATHIWQHQNRLTIPNILMNGCDVYDYELTENSDFDDFCVEQQASIIGDYATKILYPYWGRPGVSSEKQQELARVVEEKFPEARKTRLRLEAEYNKNQDKSALYLGF